MADFKRYKHSDCCNMPVSVTSDCSDFCVTCQRRITPREYYEMHGIGEKDLLNVIKTAFKRLKFRSKMQVLERTGLTKCCQSRTSMIWFDLHKCTGCRQELDHVFDEITLVVKEESKAVLIETKESVPVMERSETIEL